MTPGPSPERDRSPLPFVVVAGILLVIGLRSDSFRIALPCFLLMGLSIATALAFRRPSTSTRSGWLVPHLLGPFLAAAGFSFMLFVSARTTGAGWLIVLICLLVGAMVVGAILPATTLIGVRVRVHGPSDVVAGEPFFATIEVARPGLGLVAEGVAPRSPRVAVLDGSNRMGPIVAERGVIREMTLVTSSSAPFGMVAFRRRMTVTLESPVHVAPRTGHAEVTDPASTAIDGELVGSHQAHGDRLRSVREYAAGDAMRLVHWPVSARRGSLVVKELETAADPHVHLVVELTGVPEVDDRICEDAMALCLRALDDHRRLTLYTFDGTTGRVTAIRHRRDAGRRLAEASTGRPPIPADPHGAVVHLSRTGIA